MLQHTHTKHVRKTFAFLIAEMEMGQWVVGHGSNGSTFLDGSRGSCDPLTHAEITAQILNTITRLTTFVFLYDWPLFSVLCS